MARRKRDIEEEDTPSTLTRRRSGRVSSTPKKSIYFEGSDSEGESDLPPKKRGRPSKKLKKEESEDQYQEEDVAPSEDQYDEDEDEVAEEQKQDEEDDEDEDDDDEGVRKVIIKPLEKMRDTGGVEYEDGKLHKNTQLFLKDLKANNQRDWLKAHDGEYRRALKDWETFVDATTQNIISIDDTIPELPFKDIIFRIYRDVRFSKDPTPYKPHFSAAWSRTGRKGPYACYYIQYGSKQCTIAGGLWCPEKDHVAKLRRSIDRHPARWRRALNEPALRRVFFPNVKPGDEKAVEAFVGKNQMNALKKCPQNYDSDHVDIKLLRLKNYILATVIDENMFLKDDTQEKIGEIVQGLSSFVTFLNHIVMPDSQDESSDEDEENNDDDEE